MKVTVKAYAVNDAGTAFVTRVVSERGQTMAHGGIHNASEADAKRAEALAWIARERPTWTVVP